MDVKDKYLFERIDIITQGMHWQGDKIYDILSTIENIDRDLVDLKQFKKECETSLSVKKAVTEEKKIHIKRSKKLFWPLGAIFLGILYPAYLEAYSELGGKLIIREIIDTLLP